jgi:heme/copper-type cytochrome/quinol oxidase subunit 2
MSSLTIIVTIVIAISVSVVLFFIAYCFLRRRARKKCYTLSEENGEGKKKKSLITK